MNLDRHLPASELNRLGSLRDLLTHARDKVLCLLVGEEAYTVIDVRADGLTQLVAFEPICVDTMHLVPYHLPLLGSKLGNELPLTRLGQDLANVDGLEKLTDTIAKTPSDAMKIVYIKII